VNKETKYGICRWVRKKERATSSVAVIMSLKFLSEKNVSRLKKIFNHTHNTIQKCSFSIETLIAYTVVG
jgi:hypothetical protein